VNNIFATFCVKRATFCFLIMLASCGQSKTKDVAAASVIKTEVRDTISYDQLGSIEKERLLIEHDVNLNGAVCILPNDMTLYAKGGVIRNGVLVGSGTKIQASKAIFDRVTVKGEWNVPDISTTLFANLDYENSLRDVVALANPNVKNLIVIEKGEYLLKAEKNADVCLALCDNTDFVLKGNLHLLPNRFKHYDIVQAQGENIRIKGNGTIIGDKHTHTGEGGEWGMGIRFHHAVNASVSGLTIKDCWGDCIYVGGDSQNVLIEKCLLDHGRRQGVSVTKANSVTIRDCTITNVSGTNPQCAIDIEPNRPDSVDGILIERVTVKNCEGGVLVTRGKQRDGFKTPWIGSVVVRHCHVSSNSRVPVRINRCEEVKIEDCSLYAQKGRTAVAIMGTANAIVQNNRISIEGNLIESIKSSAKKLLRKDAASEPISVNGSKLKVVRNNIIKER